MSKAEITILSEILTELRAIHTVLLSNSVGSKIDTDDQKFAENLRTIYDQVGDRAFSVSELMKHSNVDPTLRTAIVGLIGFVNGRKMGKFLQSIEGRNIGGLCIERVSEDRDGLVWILRVCEFETRKPTLTIANIGNRGG